MIDVDDIDKIGRTFNLDGQMMDRQFGPTKPMAQLDLWGTTGYFIPHENFENFKVDGW